MGKVYKHVSDLGMAAYLLMHGYDVAGKKGRSYYFNINEDDVKALDDLTLDYFNERNYHLFDHCIMSMKKVLEVKMSSNSLKSVNDLGLAAYIFMHDFDIAGRQGGSFFFKVEDNELEEKFNKLTMEYLSSQFHRFDHCIMALKKVPEYSPK